VLKQWGIQGINNAPALTGMPGINIDNWQGWAGAAYYTYDTRYVGYDNLTFIKGRHTFKTGVSVTKLLNDGPASGPYFGYFDFSGKFTNEPWADFLLGLPDTFQSFTSRPNIAARRWEDAVFIQDDFRITSKLTLSYGLRWDKFTVPYDSNGLYYNFNPSTVSVVVPNQRALQNVIPAWPSETFLVVLANRAGYPNKLEYGSSSWQPRLGFAYRLGNRMVLRGGYGVYGGVLYFNDLQTGGPFALTDTYINSSNPADPSGAEYAWPNAYPTAVSTASVLSATGVSKNYHDPYTQKLPDYPGAPTGSQLGHACFLSGCGRRPDDLGSEPEPRGAQHSTV